MRSERSKGDIARQGDTISFTVSPCRALCFKRKIQNKLMTWDLYSQNRVCCEASPNAKSGAFICSDHSIRTITALETLTSIHSNIWYVANDLFEMKRLVWYTTHIYIYTFPTPPLQTGDIYIYICIPPCPQNGVYVFVVEYKSDRLSSSRVIIIKKFYWSAGLSKPTLPVFAEHEDLRFGQAYFQHASPLI